MNEDEAKIYDLLLRAGPLRAVQIYETLHIGFHRLYPALRNLRKLAVHPYAGSACGNTS